MITNKLSYVIFNADSFLYASVFSIHGTQKCANFCVVAYQSLQWRRAFHAFNYWFSRVDTTLDKIKIKHYWFHVGSCLSLRLSVDCIELNYISFDQVY